MNLLIILDIILFFIVVKFFVDIHNSTKVLKEKSDTISEKLKNKEEYPYR